MKHLEQKGIRQFVEIHERIQGTPPEMASPLQDVWKKLQQFALKNPLAFYELTVCFTFPKAYTPKRPWRTSIIKAGFASISKTRGKVEVTIHDLVDLIFKVYLLGRPETKELPPPPPPSAPPPPPIEAAPLAPLGAPALRQTKRKKNGRMR